MRAQPESGVHSFFQKKITELTAHIQKEWTTPFDEFLKTGQPQPQFFLNRRSRPIVLPAAKKDQKGFECYSPLPPVSASKSDAHDEQEVIYSCPILLEPMVSPTSVVPCGHTFEKSAIEEIRAAGKPCPMCNGKIEQLMTNLLAKVLIGLASKF